MTPSRPACGLLVSAPRSGSGKTILTLGLMRAFAKQRVRVAACKAGPDYIDPAFHASATGRESLNLDTWAMPPSLVDNLASAAAAGADLLIAEGAMGLFDGVVAPTGRSGASADLAARLGLPVLLVLDVTGQSQTAAAIVRGCDTFRSGVRIGGVILNRVASERHRHLVAEAVEAAGYPVLGALPRSNEAALPERHLGLVQAGETSRLVERLDAIADLVAAHVDLDRVRAIAAPLAVAGVAEQGLLPPPGQRIAVARDVAFAFLYPHLIESWRRAGTELVFFSPLADEPPPMDCDICWLPGGYPELHAARLSQSARFFDGLRRFADTRPVHGECGGYMVLGQSLVAGDGLRYPMAGLLAASFSFAERRLHLGYREATLLADCCLGPAGARLRGHEFHYATMLEGDTPDAPLLAQRDAQNNPPSMVGSRRGHVTGSFFHVVAGTEQADDAYRRSSVRTASMAAPSSTIKADIQNHRSSTTTAPSEP